MSIEEDIQLKDMVAQTLESNGSLAKIRAQLRSTIFCSLSEDQTISELQPLMNKRVKSSLETMEGKIMFCIVREFLEYFNLDCTLSVYEPESYLGKIYQYQGRHTVVEELGLEDVGDGDPHVPLLLTLIRYVQLRKNGNNHKDSAPHSEEQNGSQIDNNRGLEANLNATFEVSHPTINLRLSSTESSKENLEKYTERTHSYNSNKIGKLENSELNAPLVLKDTRNGERSKSDKTKSKSTLSEVSPIQNNKSCVSDILPSLYNKESIDKSGFRELDKMFDMKAEYEEDLMYSSDIPSRSDCLRSDSNTLPTENNPQTVKTDSALISIDEFSNDLSNSLKEKHNMNNE